MSGKVFAPAAYGHRRACLQYKRHMADDDGGKQYPIGEAVLYSLSGGFALVAT